MDKYEILSLTKIPISTDHHIGIEIEFVSPFCRSDLRKQLVKMDLQNNTQLDEDGSIDEYLPSIPRPRHICETEEYDNDFSLVCEACEGTGDHDAYGHELKVITTEKDLKVVMSKVSAFLKKAKAEVNKSCGLHVHLDCRNRNVKTVIGRFLKAQSTMRQMVMTERLVNDYCKPITKQEISRYWKKDFDSRYRDINITALDKFQTIEIRLHQGSVNSKEITDWCNYLISIADNKKGNKKYVQAKIKNAKRLFAV